MMIVGSARTTIGAVVITLMMALALIVNIKSEADVKEKQMEVNLRLIALIENMQLKMQTTANDARVAKETTADTNRVLKTQVQPRMEEIAKKAEKKQVIVRTPAPIVLRQEVYPAESRSHQVSPSPRARP